MFPPRKLLPLLLTPLSCALPVAAQASPQAQDAVLQYYRYQASFLHIYSRALDSQNASASTAAIKLLTEEFILWGQSVYNSTDHQDFRRTLLSPQSTRAREQCEALMSHVQQDCSEKCREGTNFIMMNEQFKRACTDFTQTLQQFREAMGL